MYIFSSTYFRSIYTPHYYFSHRVSSYFSYLLLPLSPLRWTKRIGKVAAKDYLWDSIVTSTCTTIPTTTTTPPLLLLLLLLPLLPLLLLLLLPLLLLLALLGQLRLLLPLLRCSITQWDLHGLLKASTMVSPMPPPGSEPSRYGAATAWVSCWGAPRAT